MHSIFLPPILCFSSILTIALHKISVTFGSLKAGDCHAREYVRVGGGAGRGGFKWDDGCRIFQPVLLFSTRQKFLILLFRFLQKKKERKKSEVCRNLLQNASQNCRTTTLLPFSKSRLATTSASASAFNLAELGR